MNTEIVREERVRTMMPVVRRIARAMSRKLPARVELDDLVAAGNLGLAMAATRFDGEDEGTFQHYAARRIRGAMTDQLRGLDTLTRYQRRRAKALASAETELTQRLGRRPEGHELAKELGVGRVECDQRRALAKLSVGSLADTDVVDEKARTPEENAELVSSWRKLERAMAGLSERERSIVELTCIEEMSLKDVGSQLGVSESRVCQLRNRAMEKLREACTASLAPPAPERIGASDRRPRQPRWSVMPPARR